MSDRAVVKLISGAYALAALAFTVAGYCLSSH